MLALSCLLIAEPARKLREDKGSIKDSIATLSKIPLFRRAVLGYCAYTGAVSAFAYWAPKYLAERYGASDHFEMIGGVLARRRRQGGRVDQLERVGDLRRRHRRRAVRSARSSAGAGPTPR